MTPELIKFNNGRYGVLVQKFPEGFSSFKNRGQIITKESLVQTHCAGTQEEAQELLDWLMGLKAAVGFEPAS